MDPPFAFLGCEKRTVVIDGTIRLDRLGRLPDAVTIDEIDMAGDRVRASVFAFDLEHIALARAPFVRSRYREVLWRVAAHRHALPVWWVLACDVDRLIPLALAHRFVRYPVRRSRISIDDGTLAIASGHARVEFRFERRPGELSRELGESRSLATPVDGELWQVPFGGDIGDAPSSIRVELTTGSASPAFETYDFVPTGTGSITRHRRHECGVATRFAE